jgi:hypothetical protein
MFLDPVHTDFSKLRLPDAPKVINLIRALRLIAKESSVSTRKTQSEILRQLQPDVLCAVAVELQDSSIESRLSSEVTAPANTLGGK